MAHYNPHSWDPTKVGDSAVMLAWLNELDQRIALLSPASFNAGSLPTADPNVVGMVWSNSGVLTVSAG